MRIFLVLREVFYVNQVEESDLRTKTFRCITKCVPTFCVTKWILSTTSTLKAPETLVDVNLECLQLTFVTLDLVKSRRRPLPNRVTGKVLSWSN